MSCPNLQQVQEIQQLRERVAELTLANDRLGQRLAERSQPSDELEHRVQSRSTELLNRIQVVQGELAQNTVAAETAWFAQNTLDLSSDCIFWFRSDGGFAYVNDAACRVLDYSRAELLALKVPEIAVDLRSEEWPAHWERMQQAGTTIFEGRHRTKSGRIFPVEISSYIGDFQLDGQPIGCAFARDLTEQIKANKALARVAAIVESTGDAILSANRDGIIESWNAGAENLFGFSAGEALGQHLSILGSAESEAEQAAILTRLAKGERFSNLEVARHRKDGRQVDVSLTLSPLREASGKVTGISGIIRDITERKRIEDELRSSEAKYRTLVETTRTGYCILDTEGRIVDANDEFIRLTGRHKREEVLEHRVTEWTAPHDLERNVKGIRKCFESGSVQHLEIDYITPQGRIIPVEINAAVITHNEEVHIVGLCHDITDRKRAEAARQENEERLRLLLDSTAEAIYGLDLAGNCTFCNEACVQLLGFEDADQLLGQNMHNLIHHSRADGSLLPEAECRIYHSFRRGKGTNVKDEVLWKTDGTKFAAEYWSYPIQQFPATCV